MPTFSGNLCSVGNYPKTLNASARRSHKLQITSPTPVQSLALQTVKLDLATCERLLVDVLHSAQVWCWLTREDVFKRELPKSVSREGIGMCDVPQSSNRNNLPLQNNRKRSNHRNGSEVELRTLDYDNPGSNPVLRC